VNETLAVCGTVVAGIALIMLIPLAMMQELSVNEIACIEGLYATSQIHGEGSKLYKAQC